MSTAVAITGKFTGIEKMLEDMTRREEAIVRTIDAALGVIARDAADRMRQAMLSAPSPSLPGSAPGVVTGNLIKAIRAVHKIGSLQAEVQIKGKAAHWHLLEFGTTKMAARPFIRPYGREAAIDGEELINRAVARIARGR